MAEHVYPSADRLENRLEFETLISDLAGLAFYEVDFGNGAMDVDDRMRDLCGIPPEREQGLQALEFWMEHLHPDDRQRVLDPREQLHDGRLEKLSVEYRYLHPARGEMWIRHLAGVSRRDATRRRVASYGVLRDITERKRIEDEMRDLSRRLIGAHEEERALLAHELHEDGNVFLQGFEMGRAFSWAVQNTGVDPFDLQKQAQQAQQQAQQAQQATAEQIENFKKAFSVCLEGNKYMVKY